MHLVQFLWFDKRSEKTVAKKNRIKKEYENFEAKIHIIAEEEVKKIEKRTEKIKEDAEKIGEEIESSMTEKKG